MTDHPTSKHQQASPAATLARVNRVMQIQAWRAVDVTIEAGVLCYNRGVHLPGLLRLWPADLLGAEPAMTATILHRLRKALQQQRRKARQDGGRKQAGSYDVNRHIALLQAWRAECRAWRTIKKGSPGCL